MGLGKGLVDSGGSGGQVGRCVVGRLVDQWLSWLVVGHPVLEHMSKANIHLHVIH